MANLNSVKFLNSYFKLLYLTIFISLFSLTSIFAQNNDDFKTQKLNTTDSYIIEGKHNKKFFNITNKKTVLQLRVNIGL